MYSIYPCPLHPGILFAPTPNPTQNAANAFLPCINYILISYPDPTYPLTPKCHVPQAPSPKRHLCSHSPLVGLAHFSLLATQLSIIFPTSLNATGFVIKRSIPHLTASVWSSILERPVKAMISASFAPTHSSLQPPSLHSQYLQHPNLVVFALADAVQSL
jgi:hypothetical protein